MNCPKCNNPIPIDARFCGGCGQPLGDATPAAHGVYSTAPAIPAGASAGGAAAASLGESGSGWSAAGFVTRIKNILLTPRAEWRAIAAERTSVGQLCVGYVAPLTACAALMSLARLTLIGTRGPFGPLVQLPLAGALGLAAWTFVASFIGMFLVGLIVNGLAATFGGTRDPIQALKVAAYSLTPAYCGSVLALSPVLPGLMQFIVLCYGLYVLYLGLPVLMRAPQTRALGYTATVVVCCFVLGSVMMLVATGFGLFANSAGFLGAHAATAPSARTAERDRNAT